MKRTNLIAVFVGFAVVLAISQDSFARNRMYNPSLGCWMQRDPADTPQAPSMARNLSGSQFTQPDPTAQYVDGPNLYQYVRSNPITHHDPTGLVTWTEAAFASWHPICAARAYKISQTIRSEHQKRYGDMDDDTILNGIYHCVWQCKITTSLCCTEALAKEIGDNHEAYAGNPANKKQMDLHNNDIGRQVGGLINSVRQGTDNTWGSCYDGCEAKARTGEIWWFKPADLKKNWNDQAKGLIGSNVPEHPDPIPRSLPARSGDIGAADRTSAPTALPVHVDDNGIPLSLPARTWAVK
jgi:uncharacterized protein RhaS with RHS repeats